MTTSVSLGSHFESFIQAQIASGRYNNVSEVMRNALRLMEEHEEDRRHRKAQLKRDLLEGIESGAGEDVDTVLDRLEAKYMAMAKKKRK
jgi:antitoxin ParD1/3/4